MIFVTVGEQLPFDRLVRTVDECATKLQQRVFAQIGNTKWSPKHIDFKKFLDPPEFAKNFQDAELIVAHAGMGTIINAMELSKSIVVMPRRAVFKEHRNDHQIATANRFAQLGYIRVVFDENELVDYLLNLGSYRLLTNKSYNVAPSPSLIRTIADFIL